MSNKAQYGIAAIFTACGMVIGGGIIEIQHRYNDQKSREFAQDVGKDQVTFPLASAIEPEYAAIVQKQECNESTAGQYKIGNINGHDYAHQCYDFRSRNYDLVVK